MAYKENVDYVIETIRLVGEDLQADHEFGLLMLEPIEIAGVNSFDESQVTVRCLIKTIPTKQWQVAREFRRRIKNKFDEVGIEIPFPHRTL